MSIKLSDDEVWYWYNVIQQQLDSGQGIKTFCDDRGINYKKFSNMSYRLVYKKFNDPLRHRKLTDLARKYIGSGEKLYIFARDNNVSHKHIGEAVTHINYVSIIERLKRERKLLDPIMPKIEQDSEMTFHQVTDNATQGSKIDIEVPLDEYEEFNPDDYIESQQQLAPQAEVIEPKNDIELSIAQGIKVLVSPNIDSMKIIKIIELLKDL